MKNAHLDTKRAAGFRRLRGGTFFYPASQLLSTSLGLMYMCELRGIDQQGVFLDKSLSGAIVLNRNTLIAFCLPC